MYLTTTVNKQEQATTIRNNIAISYYFVISDVFTAVTMKNASSGMWHRVDLVRTDVSEERVASIVRVEKSAIEEPAVCSHLFTLVPSTRICIP
jgi:hypothetical protein